jgi:hypothetical protein
MDTPDSGLELVTFGYVRADLKRVAVILHERLGQWNRQLRPRLRDQRIRWFETRSRGDLDNLLIGLVCPVVLIDLERQPTTGLQDLERVLERASDARVLVLDPESHSGVAGLARELGATHVASGCVPPPFVASLLARWIELAQRTIDRDGWSRTSLADTATDPWAWLADLLGDPQCPPTTSTPVAERSRARYLDNSGLQDGVANEIHSS